MQILVQFVYEPFAAIAW